MMNENQQIKRSILALLIKLSKADQSLKDKELVFIKDISKRIFLSEEELTEVYANYEDISLTLPKSEQERMSILYYLLFLMKIDGQVEDEERKLIQKIGFQLGFRDTMVESMVQLIKDYENKRVPPETLLATIKKYLN